MEVVAFHEAIDGFIEDRGNHLWLRLSLRGDVRHVYARIEPDNEEYLIEMSEVGLAGRWHHFEVEIRKSEHVEQTDYLFKIVTEDDSFWLGAAGLEHHMPRNIHMFRYGHDRRFPSWTASQVFYQVFPERFANGDSELSPKSNEYKYLERKPIVAKKWGELPDFKSGGFEFFGGDLIGLNEKLDYLNRELGITALYLNPVFTSQSSHKYDTTDYFNVDPHFGGNEALVKLVEDAHNKEMKVVLDAVINHTSVMHPWFQSALKGDEKQRQKYVFEGQDYGSWKDHLNLPTLDYSNPVVVDEMMTGDDSVIRHWLRPPYNIDGWRMDVVHMLGEGKGAKNNHNHLKTLRNVIKEENEQALLLGEHFFEATSWLQGDQEDCAMNYFGFAHPVRAFFAGTDIAMHPIKLDGEQFSKWLREARARIPFDHQLLQFNQLDSHDTPRFLSMLGHDIPLLKASIALLMAYIGTPCLYYGTEIGMDGGSDPGCRACFPWDRSVWNADVFEFTKAWIGYRRSFPALSKGAVVDLHAESNAIVFARVLKEEQVLVVVNRSDATAIQFTDVLLDMDSEWQEVGHKLELEQKSGELLVNVPAKSVSMWVRR